MDSGMSSTETIPRISSDEDMSQESIYYKDEKLIDIIYVEPGKDERFKKIIISSIVIISLILFTAIIPPIILLSNGKAKAYTGKCKP